MDYAPTVYRFSRYPSRGPGVVGGVFKFAGYIHHLVSQYFWPHFEKQDGRHGQFFENYLPYPTG